MDGTEGGEGSMGMKGRRKGERRENEEGWVGHEHWNINVLSRPPLYTKFLALLVTCAPFGSWMTHFLKRKQREDQDNPADSGRWVAACL